MKLETSTRTVSLMMNGDFRLVTRRPSFNTKPKLDSNQTLAQTSFKLDNTPNVIRNQAVLFKCSNHTLPLSPRARPSLGNNFEF